MELCHSRIFSSFPCSQSFSRPKPYLCSPTSLHGQKTRRRSSHAPKTGLHCGVISLPRATTSEETSTSITEQFNKATEEEIVEDEAPMDKETQMVGFLDNETQANKLLDWFNVKPESVDIYSILLYGSGALALLWISSAIVGALDSIPLFPKAMEVIGLGFTIWFGYRYLLFKRSRDELSAKIEEVKREVIGSPED